jgi:hypothetical protein
MTSDYASDPLQGALLLGCDFLIANSNAGLIVQRERSRIAMKHGNPSMRSQVGTPLSDWAQSVLIIERE